ncbi:MAG: hypothetical protein O3A13_05930 [Proteobacteria bacterium]|nr:hypothetical protein [Pseudomonadota bacterium]
MPELTVTHFALFALMLVVGVIGGWTMRASRCVREKIAVSSSWQDQLESQQSEHARLAEQNKSLMEQISQYQASQKDYSNRAKELSDSLKEAFGRRDELQRQIKDIRGNLEVAVAQRDRLKGNLQSQSAQNHSSVLKDKDDKIFRLSRELTSWQSRVPPLVERFQERDKQARALENELEATKSRLQELEELVRSDHTRIEPVDAGSLPDGGDASNEPNAITSAHDTSEVLHQIDSDFDDEYASEVESANDADNDGTIEETSFAAVFSETVGSDESDDEKIQEDGSANNSGVLNPIDDVDDLKSIKGIGPSIEKTLIGLGITRFHQIAEMSEFDIDRVAQQLKGFRSRIYREDWIGQARDLHNRKTGDSF